MTEVVKRECIRSPARHRPNAAMEAWPPRRKGDRRRPPGRSRRWGSPELSVAQIEQRFLQSSSRSRDEQVSTRTEVLALLQAAASRHGRAVGAETASGLVLLAYMISTTLAEAREAHTSPRHSPAPGP